MHGVAMRQQALDLLASGISRRSVCRQLGVGYNSTYRWQTRIVPKTGLPRCFRCEGKAAPSEYCYLLGQYLGDGHIAAVNRTTALRIYCCDAYPDIMEEVATAMRAVAHASVNYRQMQGCTQVQSATNHWLCLFPQHGPGRKHERPVVLED